MTRVEEKAQAYDEAIETGRLLIHNFVFPKYLYARTRDNKTIDMSYAPQDMTAVEYIRNDFVEQKQSDKSKKNCNKCPHCVDRKDQYGWHFKGCFGGTYKGKFIAEIDECPLKQEQPKDLAFTHIKPTDDEKQAAVHYMEDCEEVDDFVRRNIDGIAERYFGAGAKWKEKEQEHPKADLEKAARCVYESWMGGTIDDVRRDMVELGKALNAKKEE